ncbi:MAG UNVERIFIED_CONTAM: hypothetical protein LVR18_32425 [Planctomycetaceae bacterium]|jgi:hypothetical protein
MFQHPQAGSAWRYFSQLTAIIAALTTGFCLVGISHAVAQQRRVAPVNYGERVTRLVWQDPRFRFAVLGRSFRGQKWTITAAPLPGFPKLTAGQQDFAQMDRHDGWIVASVRGRKGENGELGASGWVAVDSGVRAVSHGNHSDWTYPQLPSVRTTSISAEGGNPAHMYVYDGQFFMANDGANGFSILNPADFRKSGVQPAAVPFTGGGRHITLAAIAGKVCYATWIDAEGDNAGRVDVVNLKKPAAESLAYSIRLPSGVIHGATVNSGKAFFAPRDGICWVAADENTSGTPESVEVHHLSLGTDLEAQQPLRTGGFVNHRNWVLFTTGRGEQSALCLINAAKVQPQIVRLPITVTDGLTLTTPEVVLAAGGRRLVFLFQDRHRGRHGCQRHPGATHCHRARSGPQSGFSGCPRSPVNPGWTQPR